MIARWFHLIAWRMYAFGWWRPVILRFCESMGTLFGQRCGDFCVYHFGIVHSLMVEFEDDPDEWHVALKSRYWISRYESRRA